MCAKFHFNCVYLKNYMEGGPFRLPPPSTGTPKKASINRVKETYTNSQMEFHKNEN